MLRTPNFLDSRLTDAGKVVSLTRPPRFTPQKHFLVLISVRDRVNSRVIVRLERLDKLKEINDLIGNNLEFSK
jgi:hypothetical protein